jgi:hypothetical protein
MMATNLRNEWIDGLRCRQSRWNTLSQIRCFQETEKISSPYGLNHAKPYPGTHLETGVSNDADIDGFWENAIVMLVGYARVSTDAQTTDVQIDALKVAGCERVFEESMSGTRADRPELAAALDYAREGDVLVVARLDRLARSLRQLLTTVDTLNARGIGLRSLHENIDTTSATGRLILHIFCCARPV